MRINCKFTPLFVSLAGLMLAGCATQRPPRQVSGPARHPMPPTFEETYHQPVPVRPAPVEVVRPAPVVIAEPLPAPLPPPATLPPRAGTPHTVRRGETLSAIALQHRMTWRELADFNSIADPNSIRVGQTILIPPAPGAAAPAPAVTPRAAAPVAGDGHYVVQPGDNLTVIARRHNTTVSALRQVNNLTSDTIRVGQRLTLPQGSAAPATPAAAGPESATPATPRAVPTPRPVATPATPATATPAPAAPEAPAPPADDRAFTIVVEEGDTLESISASYVVSVEALRRENNLAPNAQVRPGDRLRIPPTSW